LLEAAAMLSLARQTAGSEHEQNRILEVAKPRTTCMAGEHDVVVSGAAVSSNVLSHFNHCMHMAGMHQDHGRHGHLSPSHHGHKHHRRNGLLHHAALCGKLGAAMM